MEDEAHPEICSSVPLRQMRELVLERLLDRRDPAGRVDVEDLASTLEIREGEVEFSIESSWSSQRWVDGVRSVRRSNDDDLTCNGVSMQVSRQRQGGTDLDHPFHPSRQAVSRQSTRGLDLVCCFVQERDLGPSRVSSGRSRDHGEGLTIDLIEEDDTRLASFCFVEEETQLSLGLSDPLGQTIRTLTHKERCKYWSVSQRWSNRVGTHRSCDRQCCNSQRELERAASYPYQGDRGRGHREEG